MTSRPASERGVLGRGARAESPRIKLAMVKLDEEKHTSKDNFPFNQKNSQQTNIPNHDTYLYIYISLQTIRVYIIRYICTLDVYIATIYSNI